MSRHSTKYHRHGHWGLIFVLPFLAIFLVFQAVPIANTIYLSFTDMKGASLEHHFVGLANFGRSSQSIVLEDLDLEQARRLAAALQAAGLDCFTDAPAADDAAVADVYGLDAGTPQAPVPTAFKIKVTKLDEAGAARGRQVLLDQGLDAARADQAVSTVWSGLLFDRLFWTSFGNTLLLFVMSFVPQFCIALLFAVWFADFSLRLRISGWFKTIFYIPNIIMTSSIVVFFTVLFAAPFGPVNNFLLHGLGLTEPIYFLRSEFWSRGIVAFIQFWMFFGTTLIVLSAGVLGIPHTLVESAVIDGARSSQVFWHITLPLLRPIILFSFVTSLITGLQMFDIPFLMGGGLGSYGGATSTTAIYMYGMAFSSAANYSYGAAISTGMLVLMVALAALMFRLFRGQQDNTPRKDEK